MHSLNTCKVFALLLLITCAACRSATSETTPSTAAPTLSVQGPTLPTDKGTIFAGSGVCAACHTTMTDETGKNVSIANLWRSSMLANSGRDPYWQATVRSEVIDSPELQTEIEEKCAVCHMPMAATTLNAENALITILDDGFSNPSHPLYNLARDGVSCTLCHQLEAGNFKNEDTHSGAYLIDLALPSGQRYSYGIFATNAQNITIMQSVSGYVPVQSNHVEQAEMCRACHDLITPYIDANGQVAGVFPEQMIYSEWANSSYNHSRTCQSCHMPLAQGSVSLSSTGSPPRAPFYQHLFVGGNAFMLRIFQANAEKLNVFAAPEHFSNTIAQTENQIATQTANLTLENVHLEGKTLVGTVVIQSQVGHKFPAGYPSRRAWLHISVLDANGKIVFESGAFRPDGFIIGNDNDADWLAYEPHYTLITAPDQVQIYEAIMLNAENQVTTTLLRGATYTKDNRLLPVGFDLTKASSNIAVYGEASQDNDFLPGGDRLTLEIDLGKAVGPFTLRVELCYQSIGYRWAQNLASQSFAEAQSFATYYDSVPNLPLLVAIQEIEIGK